MIDISDKRQSVEIHSKQNISAKHNKPFIKVFEFRSPTRRRDISRMKTQYID
jgi:hypothetical protein